MSVRMKALFCAAAALFVLCIGSVVYLGVSGMPDTVTAAALQGSAAEMDPMESFKTVRQQLRSMQKAQLNDVAHGAENDPELAAMAQRQLLELCQREEQELTLEGILQMRGWSKCVVTVHRDSVNVLLKAQTITRQESAVILDLVCRETGAMSGNVKIIPIN